jgi:hypothetical protein
MSREGVPRASKQGYNFSGEVNTLLPTRWVASEKDKIFTRVRGTGPVFFVTLAVPRGHQMVKKSRGQDMGKDKESGSPSCTRFTRSRRSVSRQR